MILPIVVSMSPNRVSLYIQGKNQAEIIIISDLFNEYFFEKSTENCI